jgi:type II secretory pathway component PulM
MKEWWNSLSLRDKRIGLTGLLILVIAILYSLIWNPLIKENERLRERVQQNNELLAWMKTASEKIQVLQKNVPLHSASQSSLSIVQDELKKSGLTEHFTDLKQSENDSVQLHFQAIHFDALIQWLIKIGQEQDLITSQINVIPVDATGIVNGEMTLKKSS